MAIFIDDNYDTPNRIVSRIPYWHYREENALHVSMITKVVQSADELAHIVEQLQQAEEAYVEATREHRDRFSVLVKLMMA